MAAAVPTFGKLLHKVRKVNPEIGMIEEGVFYDVSELSEHQFFLWANSIMYFSAVNFMMVYPNASKDTMVKIYHGALSFDYYKFVKKLQNQKIWSSKDIFSNIKDCMI